MKNNMMENMMMATFENIEDAKEVYKILKDDRINRDDDLKVLQVVVVQNQEGVIKVVDQHLEIFSELGKTMIGGVVGVVLGVLIGPFAGFVLGGLGAMIGSGFDLSEQTESEGMLYQMYSRIYEGDIAILAIVQEANELKLNTIVGKVAKEMYRWDAAEIREEAEYAETVQTNLITEGKKKMTEQKDETRKKRVLEYKEKIKQEFEKIEKKENNGSDK